MGHENYAKCKLQVYVTTDATALIFVNTAASDSQNLCMQCLASVVDICLVCLFQNLRDNSAKREQFV